MKYFLILCTILLLNISPVKADETTNWLKGEIDTILNIYNQSSITDQERFDLIENTINQNFAGAGIAKFVAGNSWNTASKKVKKQYINLFKRHLTLNIVSMMQGYSNQEYSLINSKYDAKNKVSLIDMEIATNTGKFLVTWRVKKSKNRNYVIDLLVADISLVVTKRSEFHSMLKKVDNNLERFNEVLKSQNENSYAKLIN